VTVLPSLHRGKSESATMRKSLAALKEAVEPAVGGAPAREKQRKDKGTSDRQGTVHAAFKARVVPIHPASPFPTTYFIGGLGAGDELYLSDVAAALGPSYRSFALLYPGMSDGEAPIADVVHLAEAFADRVAADAPGQPVALVGHSVGGAIAFETARLLERRGANVAELVLIDAPLHSETAANAAEVWDTPSFADYVKRVTAAGWVTPDIADSLPRRDKSPDVWARLERTWSASIEALRAYHPDGAFHGPTTFITPARPQDGLVECASRWRALCPTLEIMTTAGNHLTMVRAPYAAKVAQLIRRLSGAGELELDTRSVM
jgi:thioesterase domain-containing protein